jgi:uncharacterized protein (DUF736 family)
MIIGTFQHENGIYAGSVPSIAGSSPVRLAPTDKKGVDYAVTLAGAGTELGVAWKKTSSKGNEYLSVKLDAPNLPAAVNCALIKQAEGFALIWNRREPVPVEEEEAAAA